MTEMVNQQVNGSEAVSVCNALLNALKAMNCQRGVATVAVAMLLGVLSAPNQPDETSQNAYTKSLLSWTANYWQAGSGTKGES